MFVRDIAVGNIAIEWLEGRSATSGMPRDFDFPFEALDGPPGKQPLTPAQVSQAQAGIRFVQFLSTFAMFGLQVFVISFFGFFSFYYFHLDFYYFLATVLLVSAVLFVRNYFMVKSLVARANLQANGKQLTSEEIGVIRTRMFIFYVANAINLTLVVYGVSLLFSAQCFGALPTIQDPAANKVVLEAVGSFRDNVYALLIAIIVTLLGRAWASFYLGVFGSGKSTVDATSA